MKTPLVFVFLLFVNSLLFGQVFTNLDKVELKGPSDYSENEALVLECADYMLYSPVKENETNKLYAIQFIMRWMEGTPDHSFTIGPDFLELTEGKAELSGLYLASLVKASIDHSSKELFQDELNEIAKELFLDYCADPKNKVRKTKELKKIIKEREG